MAEENEDGASKTEAPTQRRLAEARAKGDIPKSPDVASFATLAGSAAAVIVFGGLAARQMAASLTPFLSRPDEMDLSANGGVAVAREALQAASPALWVLGATAAAAVAGNVAQQGFVWTTSKLAPDPSRLSPMAGFKRLFGIDGAAHFVKSLLKVFTIGAVAYMILEPRAVMLRNLPALGLAAVLRVSAEAFKALLIGVLIVLSAIALADFLWQRYRFMQRLSMTKEEIKEDTKQSDGDPHIKAKLRAQRMKRARQRMIQQVPKATLVVMNPTHYAVALRYISGETVAPVCVAKGLDDLALKIRGVAEDHSIPVVEDAPLARALYATLEVDQPIPREHYEAVARIIGFIMGKRRPPARPPLRSPARPNADLRSAGL
jgi:flagellar biosynthetic protein FlhB